MFPETVVFKIKVAWEIGSSASSRLTVNTSRIPLFIFRYLGIIYTNDSIAAIRVKQKPGKEPNELT